MLKHPVKSWFKDSTTGELERFGEPIKQIHARHTNILPNVETGSSLTSEKHEDAGTNKSSPQANTNKVQNRMLAVNVYILQLLETFKPFCHLALTQTPLSPHFERWQLFTLNQTLHCTLGHAQDDSGFLDGQQAQRLITVFHRCFHAARFEQRQCHHPGE